MAYSKKQILEAIGYWQKKLQMLNEATIDDFFMSSIGTFKYMFYYPSFEACDNKVKSLGYKRFYVSRSKYDDSISSAYYTDENHKKLVRVSNHWSETNIDNTLECGNIRSCYWRLQAQQGAKALFGDRRFCFIAGIVDFSKLGKCTEYLLRHPWKFFGDTLEWTSQKPGSIFSDKTGTKEYADYSKKMNADEIKSSRIYGDEAEKDWKLKVYYDDLAYEEVRKAKANA